MTNWPDQKRLLGCQGDRFDSDAPLRRPVVNDGQVEWSAREVVTERPCSELHIGKRRVLQPQHRNRCGTISRLAESPTDVAPPRHDSVILATGRKMTILEVCSTKTSTGDNRCTQLALGLTAVSPLRQWPQPCFNEPC